MKLEDCEEFKVESLYETKRIPRPVYETREKALKALSNYKQLSTDGDFSELEVWLCTELHNLYILKDEKVVPTDRKNFKFDKSTRKKLHRLERIALTLGHYPLTKDKMDIVRTIESMFPEKEQWTIWKSDKDVTNF